MEGSRLFPPVLALGFILMAMLANISPAAGMLAAASAGALHALRSWKGALAALAGLALWVLLRPPLPVSLSFWTPVILMAAMLLLPSRALTALTQLPRLLWPICILLTAACLFLAVTSADGPGRLLVIPACIGAALLAAGLACHLTLAGARILTGGEHGLEAVTRDLLFGRIAGGMLHDLSQPLNVISMANGNLGYLVEHLDIAPDQRAQMVERIRRITSNTESAASILSLFRWFGRDGSVDHGVLSIRTALERAIGVTRSNAGHGGVTVELQGDALDHRLPERHGAIEMMAVTALMSAFRGFVRCDGDRAKAHGTVTVRAEFAESTVAVTVGCVDDQGQATILCKIDPAMLWLIGQVAQDNDSDFDFVARKGRQEAFRILVPRGDGHDRLTERPSA